MNFTIEHEVHQRLSFLDLCIHRSHQKFVSSVYRKPTFPGLGISFFSFCYFRFKINFIKSMMFRGDNLPANYQLKHLDFEFLRKFHVNNDFPLNLVESQIRNFLSKDFFVPVQQSSTEPNFNIFIPYFGSQSDKLRRELHRLLSKCVPYYSFIVIQLSCYKICSLSNYKDRLPSSLRSSLVDRYAMRMRVCGFDNPYASP